MSIRKEAWDKIAKRLSRHDTDVHEDQDISCALNIENLLVQRKKDLVIEEDEQVTIDIEKLRHYENLKNKTKEKYRKMRADDIKRVNDVDNSFRIVAGIIIGVVFKVLFTIIGHTEKLVRK